MEDLARGVDRVEEEQIKKQVESLSTRSAGLLRAAAELLEAGPVVCVWMCRLLAAVLVA